MDPEAGMHPLSTSTPAAVKPSGVNENFSPSYTTPITIQVQPPTAIIIENETASSMPHSPPGLKHDEQIVVTSNNSLHSTLNPSNSNPSNSVETDSSENLNQQGPPSSIINLATNPGTLSQRSSQRSQNLNIRFSNQNISNSRKNSDISAKSGLAMIENINNAENPENNNSENFDYTMHPAVDAGNAMKLRQKDIVDQDKQCRFMARNGRYLVKHKGKAKRHQRYVNDFFTTFVDMKWRYTLLSFALFFIVSWLFFAGCYYLIESVRFHRRDTQYNNELVSSNSSSVFTKPSYGYCVSEVTKENLFTGMFLFSLETQTTIGYGYRAITAECPEAILLLIIQSVVGCLIDAFTAGYIIAKFSRPKKRAATLLFSKHAVICQRDGKLCLMFRVGNLRKSLLVEATIRMLYIAERRTNEKEYIPLEQRSMTLDLGGDSEKILLVTPQIVCHPIDQESPLYELSQSKLEHLSTSSDSKILKQGEDPFERFEIIVVLEGQVESTGMTMQARVSYVANEIKWGCRFQNILDPNGQRSGYKVNFQHFNMISQCRLKDPRSAKEIEEEWQEESQNPEDEDDVSEVPESELRRRNNIIPEEQEHSEVEEERSMTVMDEPICEEPLSYSTSKIKQKAI